MIQNTIEIILILSMKLTLIYTIISSLKIHLMNIPIFQLLSIFHSVKLKESRNTHQEQAPKSEVLLQSPFKDKSSRNSLFKNKIEENQAIMWVNHRKEIRDAVAIVKTASVQEEKILKVQEESPENLNITNDFLCDFIKISFKLNTLIIMNYSIKKVSLIYLFLSLVSCIHLEHTRWSTS